MTQVQTATAARETAHQASESEPTRQLCAAAELDIRFARQVLDVLRREPHRAIAASPGVDLVPVAAHALATYRRWLSADVVLVALWLWSWALVPIAVSAPALGYVASVASLLITYTMLFMVRWRGQQIATSRLTPDSFDAEQERSLAASSPEARALDAAQTGNVTLYSGFSPFMGAGAPIGGWSFALSLKSSDDGDRQGGSQAVEFPLRQLYDAVCSELALAGEARVDTEQRVFVDGRDVRESGLFVAAALRPRTTMDDGVIDKLRESGKSTMRYVSCVRVVDWEGDLVVSVFLRFARVGGTLYAEASYALLPPIKEKLRRLDRLVAEPRPRRVGEVLVRSLLAAWYRPFYAWFVVSREIYRWWERRRTAQLLKRQSRRDGLVDYGAPASIRELAAGPLYRRYFQRLDKEMYVKIIERRVLDAIVSFLDDRGVDTSELKHRRETILNQGVMISGGDVKFENTQVGSRSRMRVSQVRSTTTNEGLT